MKNMRDGMREQLGALLEKKKCMNCKVLHRTYRNKRIVRGKV
jgi:hypothetical protein